MGPKGRSRRCGEVKNILHLPGMESQFVAHGQATVLTEIPCLQLPTLNYEILCYEEAHSVLVTLVTSPVEGYEKNLIRLPIGKHNCKTYTQLTCLSNGRGVQRTYPTSRGI
jgi:hypothetical protein